jgi:hypothetical protein
LRYFGCLPITNFRSIAFFFVSQGSYSVSDEVVENFDWVLVRRPKRGKSNIDFEGGNMLQKLYADVYYWDELHGKPGKTYKWNSFVIHISQVNVLALIDPLPLSTGQLQAIEELGTPTHILLTCNWHLRESETFRQRWGCKVLVNALGIREAEIQIDETFKHGDLLWNLVECIEIPDISWPEETALLVKQEEGLLIVGDALVGGRADLGVLDGEIGIHPNRFHMKHLTDIQKSRRSLTQLMEYPFDAVCFGHGTPILYKAKAALQRFIDRLSNELSTHARWSNYIRCHG